MKNEWFEDANYIYIAVNFNKEKFHTVIDKEDFEKVNAFEGTWYGKKYKSVDTLYVAINHEGRTILLHRLIADATEGEHVDHKEHNTMDNRKRNLRVGTQGENNKNKRTYVNNTSGYPGVVWYKQTNKWRAQGSIPGKRISLGYFDDIEEAARAVKKFKEANDYKLI